MAYLDQFLRVIVNQGGSDLHIGEGQPPKMRKHGDIAPIGQEPITHDEALSMLSVVCGPHSWEIFDELSISPTRWMRLHVFAVIT